MEIQIVEGGAVVNCILVADGATISADGRSAAWPGGVYAAPVGATLMAQTGAGIGWILAAGALVAPAPPALSAGALKAAVNAECKRRILAVASQEAQTNIIGYLATGSASTDDKSAFGDSVTWIAAMRAAAQTLIAAADQTFALDSHWPACPPGVAALAARF